MKQMFNHISKQVWVLLLPAMLAVAGALGMARPAAAFMPIEIKELVIKAPVQEVDTDGDGETEPFSAYVEAYADGQARGSIYIGVAHNLTLKRGIPACVDGLETAILEGTLYETIGGTQVEVGDVTVHVSLAGGNGGGGGGINFDFDIINNAAHLTFTAQGVLVFTTPPCSS